MLMQNRSRLKYIFVTVFIIIHYVSPTYFLLQDTYCFEWVSGIYHQIHENQVIYDRGSQPGVLGALGSTVALRGKPAFKIVGCKV